MIDHVSFSVSNFDKALNFYDETLKVLGFGRYLTFEDIKVALYGSSERDLQFSISTQGDQKEQLGAARGLHFAFKAKSRAQVDLWHEKALSLGGKCNGKPGLRAEYHPNYYAAFIIDPDGWRIEAVCHTPI